MNRTFFATMQSSVIKKQILGVTGLLLCGFLLSHMIGNFLILVGDGEAFNLYAHALVSNPLIYIAEAGLAAIFLTHIGLAIKLTIENKQARPQAYHMKQPKEGGSTFASSTMPYTGLIILVFLVLHILHFKFGTHYTITYDGLEVRDMHRTVLEYLASPIATAWYIFAMISLGIHVSHGFWSAFQSIGINHPKYNCTLKFISKAYGLLITVGFSAIAIFCYMQGGK